MPEWSTYTLQDFLMFAPRTYWRLVALYNAACWPLQVLAGLGGAAALAGAWRRPLKAARPALAALALAWLWVGWAFHWQRYAPINWAAQYLALAWGVQAALLLACAARPTTAALPPHRQRLAGLALGLAGLLYPLAAPLAGRPWAQAEAFGLMPEPTALATLGLLWVLPLARRWLIALAIWPTLSLLVGFATLWAFAS